MSSTTSTAIALVDPARAGMILIPPSRDYDKCRGPRASGDDPNADESHRRRGEWTPRERG